MAYTFSFKLIVLLFSMTIVSCVSTAQDQARLKEVNRIWSTFPLYAGMIEVHNSTSSGPSKAFVSKTFRSKAGYDDVKRFYLERLRRDGWQLTEERPLKVWERDLGGRLLRFRKGDYEASVEYAGEKSEYEWDYGIGIGWMPKPK